MKSIFGILEVKKSTILSLLETLFNLDIDQKISKIQSLKNGKNGSFRPSRFSKIDFM